MSTTTAPPRPVTARWWLVNGTFIAATLGVIVWEMAYAWDHNPDTMPWTDLLASYVPAPVTYGLLALLVAWLPGHIAYAIHRVKGAQATATPAAMGANVTIKPAWWWRWLHDDARNRAWRTFLHTVAAAALLGGLDAGGQLLRDALSQTMAGQAVDWRQVGATMGVGALMALLTPALAYAHRVELDPSPLPSAAPPPPPEWPAAGTRPEGV